MTEAVRENCTCYYVSRHEGRDAQRYMAEHLVEVGAVGDTWNVEFRCPLYGRRWLADHPGGVQHGGVPYRLRTFDSVCRDINLALSAVSALAPSNDEAASAVATLKRVLGDCSDYGRGY